MATKHAYQNGREEEKRPAKRAKLLEESDASEAEEQAKDRTVLHINKDYARRFEHNKKRAELHQLEEKYGKSSGARGEDGDTSDASSSDETEDDEGFLATGKADTEFEATLRALKQKDPKIYDKSSKFYTEPEEESERNTATNGATKKEKSMTLRDYHRENLLSGNNEGSEREEVPFQTYAEEQDALKRDIITQMHASGNGEEDSEDEENDLLVRKSVPPARADGSSKVSEIDIKTADKDPEKFLSNYLASRAWVAEDSRFAPFDSDDSEEDERAEKFEEAYNLRFENPALSNTNIISHSRSAVSKFSVRRDETNPRKRARDKERERKDAEKAERDTEKARLRKLRTEEVEEKVAKIKEAAGLRGVDADVYEWADILEQDWDDERWNEEFEKRFGDTYYEGQDQDSGVEAEGSKKKKPKKPQFDDDINIKDLIPDFSEDELEGVNTKELLSDEDEEMPDADEAKPRSKKDRLAERAEKKKASRRDRRIIEQIVENSLPTDAELVASQKTAELAPFRYRETSPTSFGLTALDILSASDAQLNDFVGLKKLTPFRDPERKAKERKKISKKGRLREWRKDVFADNEHGSQTLKATEANTAGNNADGEGNKKKRKKVKKSGAKIAETTA